MFEEMTMEYLLEEALSRVSDKLDKREGAIIYDTLAPVCCELARAYADLDLALEQMFPQTAAREYLLLIAKQRGFVPKEATCLEIKAYIDAEVPVGARFNMQQYNYAVAESLGGNMYRLVCETAGSAPNNAMGTLTPINYIAGLGECRVEGIMTPGTDEEDTEAFRQRFLESISQTQAFGGNCADYRAKLKAVEGIGQVKVFAADDWLGAGTVGIYITDENCSTPAPNFVAAIEEWLDPSIKGNGLGVAPIGHIVNVYGAGVETVDISLEMKLEEGTDEEMVSAELTSLIQQFFSDRNEKWETQLVAVYPSQIIALAMDISGVLDVTGVEINGGNEYICKKTNVIALGGVEVSAVYV